MIRQLVRVLVMVIISAIASSALISAGGAATEKEPDDVRSIAFFGFRLINTSIQPPSEAEFRRLKLLDALIDERLRSSGRYKVVPVPEEVLRDVARGQDFGECQCEADYGKKVGAQLVGWGTVEKVSNLILNINLYISDVQTNQYVFLRSVDIRSNSDRSWTKGLEWLLKNYLLPKAPAKSP